MIRVKVRMIRARQVRTGMARDELENGEKFEDFVDFGWISRVKWWGKARSTCNTTNSRIKINKTSSYQQITKKIRASFGGEFSKLGQNQQNQARKQGVGTPNS